MALPRTYLDHNATTPLRPEARAVMVEALDLVANASSVHSDGQAARRMVEAARAEVAQLCNARPEHVVFTSGATEAASTLLTPGWRMGRAPLRMSRLYVGATEHACILAGGRFEPEQITVLPVGCDGVIDLYALDAALSAHDMASGLPLLAVQLANNETGVVQPWSEIGRIARQRRAVTIVDAVQAGGRIPLDITDGYVDFLILSSHKIGGPMGAGAIVCASDLMMPAPLVTGGGQERGHRAGTENVAAIAGFGAAARAALGALDEVARIRQMRDAFEAAILALVPDAIIFGTGAERLCNTVMFGVPGFKAETAQMAFDLSGVSLSAGSACSSGKVGASHVLKAMGFADEPGGLRVSIGTQTDEADLALFRDALAGMMSRRADRPRAA